MNRLHLHVNVPDLSQSIAFYEPSSEPRPRS